MQVSRIEIFGFKSFMDRLVLSLDSGVTGIVGPNGCGKSNIVDAVRWVLGETRAKNLRGGVLEDVIFNGTEKLRPLGLAEVSLCLKSQGENFLEDLISPDLEARLIAEMSEDSEGADSEEEVSDPSEINETGLELTDGGVKADLSEEEASMDLRSKMEISRANIASLSVGSLLEKFSWLKNASEVQVTRRLYRSGESECFINRVPCRLKDLKDFFRAVGLSAKGFTIVAQGEISNIITSKPEQRRKLLEEAAGVQGFRDRINSTQSRLNETTANIERLDDIIKEVSRQVATLRRQATRAENREELKAEIIELDWQIYRHQLVTLQQRGEQIKAKLAEALSTEESADQKFQESRGNDLALRNELVELDTQSDTFRTQLDQFRNQLTAIVNERAKRANRLSQLKSSLSSAENEQKSFIERVQVLSEREEQAKTGQEEIKKLRAELQQEIDQVDQKSNQVAEQSYQTLKQLREKLQEKEKEYRRLRESSVSYNTEFNTLSKQIESNLKPHELKNLARELGLGQDLKVLLDGIKVEKQYAEALEAVLSDSASFIINDNPQALAKSFASKNLKAKISLGIIKSEVTSEIKLLETPFPALYSLISCEPEFSSAVWSVVKDYYLVPNLDQAWEYFQKNPESKIRLVTPEGVLVQPNLVYFASKSSGLLKIKARIEELSALITQNNSDLEVTKIAQEQLALELKNAQRTYDAEQAEIRATQARTRELVNRLGALNGRLQAESRVIDQISFDLSKVRASIESNKQRISQVTLELVDFENQPGLDSEQETKLQLELERCTASYQEHEVKHKAMRQEYQAVNNQINELRDRLDAARRQTSEVRLLEQKRDLEQLSTIEKIVADYGENYAENFPVTNLTEGSLMDNTLFSSAREKLGQLKSRLIREGEIDPESIIRYQEESERLADLELQRKDLSDALKTIRQSLEQLTITSVKRFQETFSKVSENFSRLIPKLFGGGMGSLELTDPNNPLDSGLDIVAKPPGKKLKSIDLMSGGEKAMCATALIVSMFLVRPSPLCILDEVDAPLDEANLGRFLSVIKEMSSETQFLLVTHNKQSMSMADKLVGVTMEQPGSTKVLQVSLQDAYSHVA